MKTLFLKITAVLGITVLFSTTSFAQNQVDTTMIVNGVCGMCEFNIESAATGLKGVKSAEWDVETKILTVSYDPRKLSLSEISDAVNAAGYDTEYNTAPDEAYNKLHHCCHYRDPEVMEEHKSE